MADATVTVQIVAGSMLMTVTEDVPTLQRLLKQACDRESKAIDRIRNARCQRDAARFRADVAEAKLQIIKDTL